MEAYEASRLRLADPADTKRVLRMAFTRGASFFFLALVTLAHGASQFCAADDWTIKAIDGKTESVALSAIDEQGVVFAGGKEAVAKLADLREIRSGKPAPPPLAPQTGVLLELTGGGKLAGATIEMRGEAFAVKLGGENASEVQVPLDAVAAIRFSPAVVQPAFQDALVSPSPDSDQILALADGQLQPLKGLLSNITAGDVEFEFEGASKKLEKAKVFGIVLAKAAGAPRYHRLHLTDGSTLPAKSVAFADGNFVLKAGEASSKLPAALVHRIEFVSDRLLFLSDLEPASVIEKPLLMLRKPWQRDKSIRGGAIKLGGVEYSKGIGVQPRSQLVFKLPPQAQSFLAVVGIDASSKGRGACVFQVLGDGRSLFQQAIKGNETPIEVQVDVSGVEELTLLVEAGEDLDLSDHADWADARVLLKAN